VTNPSSEPTRTAMVSVRLSREEEEELRAEANENGESLSQFIRDVLRRRSEGLHGTADVRLYPVSSSVVAGGLALEAENGSLVPRTSQPYVTTSVTG
jgi:hypothetical protein